MRVTCMCDCNLKEVVLFCSPSGRDCGRLFQPQIKVEGGSVLHVFVAENLLAHGSPFGFA